MNIKHIAASRGNCHRKHAICRILMLAGVSILSGAAHAASLVIDSGAGTGNQGALFSIDESTGGRALISDFGNTAQGPLGVNPSAVTLGAGGKVLITDLDAGTDSRGALFSVDPTTGNRTLISDFGNSAQGPLGEDPVNLAPGAAGEILVADLDAGTGFSGALFSVDPANGNRTLISDFSDSSQGPLGEIPLGVALDSSGKVLTTLLFGGTESGGALFKVDPATGSRTLVSDFGNAAQGPLGEIPFGLKINGAGKILVVDEDAGPDFRGGLFSVDPATGKRTLISDFGNAAQGPLAEDPVNLTLDASGKILVVDFTAGAGLKGQLFKVNSSDGRRVLVTDFSDSSKGPLGQTPFGVAFIPPLSTKPGTLQFSAANYNATENTVGVTINVTRAGGSDGQVSAQYVTSKGSATEGADYTFANGSVVFAGGDTVTKSFTVPIIDDGDIEGNETLNLTLLNPDGGATLGSPTRAVVTIADNDVAPSAMCAGKVATMVGTTAGDTLNGTPGVDVIQVLAGNDVVHGNGGDDVICGGLGADQLYGTDGNDQLSGDRGNDQLFGEAGNDKLDGGADADRCDVGLPVTGNTTTNCETITKPAPGSLQFGFATYSVNEGGGSAAITVNRKGGSEGGVSVKYAATSGSATQGADFTVATGTLSFAANDAAAKTFAVPIINDTRVENNETIKLSLTNPAGGTKLGSPGAAVLTIVDNDKPAANCAGIAATILGTNAGNRINGTSGRDVIQGLGGGDVIHGNGGDDVICGGAGNDQLFGETGKDQLYGNGGFDRLDGGGDVDRCDGGVPIKGDLAANCETRTNVP